MHIYLFILYLGRASGVRPVLSNPPFLFHFLALCSNATLRDNDVEDICIRCTQLVFSVKTWVPVY